MNEVTPSGILQHSNARYCDGDERSHPLRNTAIVQHLDHAPNSLGSGSSFIISGIGSPRTIRAGRPPDSLGSLAKTSWGMVK
jgi:hypothetical protein